MGRLKTGINKLTKVIIVAPGRVNELRELRDTQNDKIWDMGNKIDAGYDSLYLYLVAKFKKENSTPEQESNKTLKDIMDPNVKDFVSGILQWKNDIKKQIKKLNTEQSKIAGAVEQVIDKSLTEANGLKSLAQKKKKKWLVSKKYKSKQRTYIKALDDILDVLKKAKVAIGKVSSTRFDESWVDNTYNIGVNLTVAEIKQRASMSLTGSLKTYEQKKKEIDNYESKFRDEYKTIPGQIKIMQSWMKEADEMEKEAEKN